MKEATPDPPLLYSRDPLAFFLIQRAHLGPLKVGLLVLSVELISDVVPSAYLDVLFANQRGVTGFFESWTFPFFYFVVVPVTWAFYLWISKAPRDLFNELDATAVLKADKMELNKEITKYAGSLYNSWWWVFASIAVVACAGVTVQETGVLAKFWLSVNSTLYWIKTVESYLGWYAVCMIVAKELCTIIVLRNLFGKFPVKLYPLHPDKCGGLFALSKYSIKFTYFIGVAGLGISLVAYETIRTGSFHNAYFVHFALGAYIFLSVYTFFAPLGAAHIAMKETKERWLMEISQQFQQAYESTTKVVHSPVMKLRSNIQRIEQLQEIYNLTEEFPVWPFDTKSLRRFGATLLTSVSPIVISVLMRALRIG